MSTVYITSVITMDPYESYNDGIYMVFDSLSKAEQCIKDNAGTFELYPGHEMSLVMMSSVIDEFILQ
jgi:hypothetical protein